jgi:hypothetical protein
VQQSIPSKCVPMSQYLFPRTPELSHPDPTQCSYPLINSLHTTAHTLINQQLIWLQRSTNDQCLPCYATGSDVCLLWSDLIHTDDGSLYTTQQGSAVPTWFTRNLSLFSPVALTWYLLTVEIYFHCFIVLVPKKSHNCHQDLVCYYINVSSLPVSMLLAWSYRCCILIWSFCSWRIFFWIAGNGIFKAYVVFNIQFKISDLICPYEICINKNMYLTLNMYLTKKWQIIIHIIMNISCCCRIIFLLWETGSN